MRTDQGERAPDPALSALTTLVRRSAPPASPALLSRGWSAVTNRMADRTNRRRALLRWSVVAGACAIVVVAGLVTWARMSMAPVPPTALSYRIEGGSVIEGGYLKESGSSGVKLRFTEGTEFMLAPGARGRLRSVDGAGARIAIEQGTASFLVTPRSNARWLVDAGPFLVTVKGTAFTVSWDAARELFELRMKHGQVLVTGPAPQGTITLWAGQRLAVNLPKQETLITELTAEVAWAGSLPATEPPSERETLAHPSHGLASSAAGKGPARRSWGEAVAAGDWDRILADVDRWGVKRTLIEASSEELFAVADAARYHRRVALAREALLAERRRFPGSARALDAVFLLGRLEEAGRQGVGKAIARYDEYLRQAPGGTYAAEALGRKMMATSQREGAVKARPIAEEYLRRFPAGTYAGTARALLAAR